MSLKENIRLLTQPHIDYNHAGKIVKTEALLKQLHKAERTGGKSTTSEKPIPANINAIALAQDLLDEAQKEQYRMVGYYNDNLWLILTTWETIEDKKAQERLTEITTDWIERIRNIIDPTRPRRPLHQPCSACGHKYTHGEDDKRIPALTAWVWTSDGEQLAPMENWEVTCSSCNTQWHGKEVIKSYWRALR